MSNPWTPGPWSLNADQRHVGADGETLVGEVGRLNPAEFARVTADRCLIAAAPEMAEALADVASVFEHYAALHRGKGTQDGDTKAETNAAFAGRIRALLARIRGDAP